VQFSLRLTCLCVVVAASSCGTGLSRQYEYEEEIFLDVDGSATVIVNSSIPALVALRGLDLDPQPRGRLDRRRLAGAYTSQATRVLRVSRPWRRAGRRFVQVRLDVPDVRQLATAAPFAWATYGFERVGEELVYRHRVGAAAAVKVDVAGWTGAELVAVRVHFPSRVRYHNVRRLEDGSPGQVERGNILTWPQRLSDRLAGVPLDIEARIEPTSVLATTLVIFAIAVLAAVFLLAVLIWWTLRKPPKVAS
jgi:hypothetical protein